MTTGDLAMGTTMGAVSTVGEEVGVNTTSTVGALVGTNTAGACTTSSGRVAARLVEIALTVVGKKSSSWRCDNIVCNK